MRPHQAQRRVEGIIAGLGRKGHRRRAHQPLVQFSLRQMNRWLDLRTWKLSMACCAALLPSMGPVAGAGSGGTEPERPASAQVQRPPASWRTLGNAPSIVVFPSGDSVHLRAYGLVDEGEVTGSLGRTWYLISGMDSLKHALERVLFVVSPGTPLGCGPRRSWRMAGKLMDHGGAETFYEAEVFVGEVFPDTVGIVWYDRSLMPDGQWRSNTTLLDLNGPAPDTLVYFGQARKSTTQRLAFNGKCRQLQGVSQSVGP